MPPAARSSVKRLPAGYKTYTYTSPGYSFQEFVDTVKKDFGGSLEGLTFGICYFSGVLTVRRAG